VDSRHLLTSDLTRAGYSPTELARLSRTGGLVHLRRGAWLAEEPADDVVRHRLLIAATLDLTADAVVSHGSAAVLHGLPSFETLTRVHLTRSDGRGKLRGYVHLHVAPVDASELVVLDGVAVTSLARTVVDLARALPFAEAVATGDAALRLGLAAEDLDEALSRAGRRPGIGGARRVAAFADGRSESVGESLSRVVLHRLGLAPTTLQLEVFDPGGRFVGRSDFGWEDRRTLGEFDGRVKYGRSLRSDQPVEDVLWSEKQREDELRDLGWQLARWTWWHLEHERVLEARLRRALQRGTR
jgi:predicted transcriptional regulator of viral defense system